MELPSFNPVYWLLQTAAMMITVFLIPRLKVDGPLPALATVIALAFINSHLWSTALFLSIPKSITLQAAVLLLANGVIFWVVVKLLPGIEIKGLLPALVAPIVFTICSVLIDRFGSQVDWPKVWDHILSFVGAAKDYVKQTPVTHVNDVIH